MQRVIWIVGTLLALTAFILWQRSGVKTTYVNGLPQFNTLPNREYIIQRECYVFKLKNESSSYPYIGLNDADIPQSLSQLPDDVRAQQVGTETEAVRILDTVKVGTRFRIVSVRQDKRGEVVRTTFEILLLPEADWKYPRLDAYWIMDHTPEKSGGVPDIVPLIAAPRVKL